jgi:hypothetical protein
MSSREYKSPVAKHNQVVCLIESPDVAPDHGFQEKSNKGIPLSGLDTRETGERTISQ